MTTIMGNDMFSDYTRSDWRAFGYNAEEGKEVIHRFTNFYIMPQRGRWFSLELEEQKATEDERLKGFMLKIIKVKEYPTTLDGHNIRSWSGMLPSVIQSVVQSIFDSSGVLRTDAIGTTFRYLSFSDTEFVDIGDGSGDIFECFDWYFESIGERSAT